MTYNLKEQECPVFHSKNQFFFCVATVLQLCRSCVARVSFMRHSCGNYVTRVALASHSCRTCVAFVACVALVSQSCCSCVAFVL